MGDKAASTEQGPSIPGSWALPLLLGVVVAVVAWVVVFSVVDPAPRTAEFDWAGTLVFGSLTVFGILLVLLCSSSFAFRSLFSSLATTALLWDQAVPSTTDGFAGAYWVVIALLAIVSLSIVLGFSSLLEKFQHRTA